MHVLITGATGFIGNHVTKKALEKGHKVTAVVRSRDKALGLFGESENIDYLEVESLESCKIKPNTYDTLIHLAWDGAKKFTLPDTLFNNLEPQFKFIRNVVDAGVKNIVVSGTCFEYGLCDGAINEDTPCQPVTYYGIAKVALHNSLKILLKNHPDVKLKWLRYFYGYGSDRTKSLLGQLLTAIDAGDDSFNMSSGEQGRDFIHVSTVAHNTLVMAENTDVEGVFNVGNGKPLKVIDLVKHVCDIRGSSIKLNAGYYSLPDYEPFNFYADTTKVKNVKGIKFDDGIYV